MNFSESTTHFARKKKKKKKSYNAYSTPKISLNLSQHKRQMQKPILICKFSKGLGKKNLVVIVKPYKIPRH